MTDLVSLLGRSDALSARLKVQSIEPVILQKFVASMPGIGGPRLPPEQTAILQRRMHEAAANNAVSELKSRDLRDGCKVFLHAPEPLIENADTAHAIFRRGEIQGQRSALLALVAAYVDGFREGEQFAAFASRIRELLGRWKGRPIAPWPELDKSIALFEPTKAPTNIAAAVLGGDRTPAEILTRLGLDSTRQRSGLAEAAFVAATSIVAAKRGVSVIPVQERIIEWVKDADGGLMFAKALPNAVSALLLPWEDADPPPDHRARLVEVLQALGGGDPRTKPGAWRHVREHAPQAYAALMRWLTRASVFQFFDIVDRSLARDPAGRTMWAYRRRFWTAYLLGEEGAPMIEQAWVAFGNEGARLARQAAKENTEEGLAAFGRQEDKSETHAALIMRVGDWTVVDWSHSAKCNFWRKGTTGAPHLYQARYPSGTLYNAPHSASHYSPSTFTWQKNFAEIIEEKRFFVERRSWRPKRA